MDAIRFSLLAVLFLGLCGVCADGVEAVEPTMSYSLGLNADVVSLSVSADSRYIAISDEDRHSEVATSRIFLFDRYLDTALWRYDAPNVVYSVAISADGEYIVAGSYYTVYIFHRDSNEPLWEYNTMTANDHYSVAISADGEYIVAGGDDEYLYLFNKDSSTPLWSYNFGDDGTQGKVLSIDISADGEYIVAGSSDSEVYLFDKDSSTPLWSYDSGCGSCQVHSVAITPDGEYIVAGSALESQSSGSISLLNRDGTLIWSKDAGPVRSVAITPDGEYIVYANEWGTFLYRDGTKILEGYTEDVRSLDITANGEYIVAGGDDVYLFHRNLSLREEGYDEPLWKEYCGIPQNSGTAVRCTVSIGSDGDFKPYVFSGNDDYFYLHKEWNVPLWSHNMNQNGNGIDGWTIDTSADGEYFVIGSSEFAGANSVYLFGKDSDTPIWSYETGSYNVNSVSISADGEYIAVGSENERVYLFGNDNNTPIWNRLTGTDVFQVAISANGEYIATTVVVGDSAGGLYLFHKNSSQPLWHAEDWGGHISISADGEYIAVTPDGKRYVALFHRDSNEPLWSKQLETNGATDIAITPDGEYIVIGTAEDVYFYNQSGYRLWQWSESETNVRSVDISADGEYIAVGSNTENSENFYTYLLNRTGSNLWWYESNPGGAAGNNHGNNIIDISADGKIIVSRDNHHIYVLDRDTMIVDETGRSDDISWSYETVNDSDFVSVAISADAQYIVAISGNNEHTAYLFDNNLRPSTTNSVSPLSAVYYDEIYFNGSGIDDDGTVIGYEWISSKDVFLSNEANFTISNLSSHLFTPHIISFRVQDNEGLWSKWATIDLFIYPSLHPVAIIDSINSSYITYNDTISFSGTGYDSDGTIISYWWESDIDGYLSNQANFSFTNLTVGNHTISFCVGDDTDLWSNWNETNRDWDDFTTVNLTVYPNAIPTASIDSINPSYAKFNETITFNGTGYDSDGTIVVYEWRLYYEGTGFYSNHSLSNESNFTINFTLDFQGNRYLGSNTIYFRVMDNDGMWSGWIADELIIYENTPPNATINSISPSQARFNETITFNGTGYDSNGTIVAYEWQSDIDGFLSNQSYFSMTNFSINIHTIEFRVQDNDGNWSEWVNAELTIYGNTPPSPTIDSISPSPARNNEAITFNGTGYDSDGTIEVYEWSSSVDGLLSNDRNFSMSDLSIGIHTIEFRVRDNDGAWSSAYVDITISEFEDILGCMDISADNYNHEATIDDGSCIEWADEGNNGGGNGIEENGSPYPFGIPAPSLIAALGVLLAVARRRK